VDEPNLFHKVLRILCWAAGRGLDGFLCVLLIRMGDMNVIIFYETWKPIYDFKSHSSKLEGRGGG
jgi:hypothetical protein